VKVFLDQSENNEITREGCPVVLAQRRRADGTWLLLLVPAWRPRRVIQRQASRAGLPTRSLLPCVCGIASTSPSRQLPAALREAAQPGTCCFYTETSHPAAPRGYAPREHQAPGRTVALPGVGAVRAVDWTSEKQARRRCAAGTPSNLTTANTGTHFAASSGVSWGGFLGRRRALHTKGRS
jgi:hypothetical protein